MSDINVRSSPDTAPPEAPSPALYFGGLVVTLCGLMAINATIGDPGFASATLLLTLIGFVFSYGCRRLQIQPRVLQIVGSGIGLCLLYAGVTRQWDWGMFMPGSMDKNDLRVAEVLAWGGVLWSWLLVSDDAVMFCCVPSVAMIGLIGSSNLNAEIIIYFSVYVLAATFLLIHQNYLLNRARAGAAERQRALPVSRALTMQIILSMVCGMIVLFLGTILIVPAQAVFANLTLAQAVKQLVQLGAGPGSTIAGLRYSDDPSLDIGTGEGWSASSDVALYVTPSDGQEHLWRGRTYDLYTGSGWESTRSDDIQPLDSSGLTDDGRDRVFPLPDSTAGQRNRQPVTATCQVKGEVEQFYYPAEPRSLALDAGWEELPRISTDGRLDMGGRTLAHSFYVIQSLSPPDPLQPVIRAQLRRAGTNYPPEIQRYYLGNIQNSANGITGDDDMAYFRSAVQQAVAGLPPGQRTPVDEAAAIRDWVANQCTYSLAVPSLRPDADHVHEFLAHSQRGYCDLFASAMAVLCRTQNIPARLVTGFAPGDWDGAGFNLRAMDKHAWVEVYFPGYGWLPFDPTAGTRTDGTVPTHQSSQGRPWLAWWRSLMADGPIPALLTGIIVLILGYILKTEVYDRRLARRWQRQGRGGRAGAAPEIVMRTSVGRRYAQITRAIGRLGLPRRPSETPAEYANRAALFLEAQEQALGVPLPVAPLQALSAQFAAARYSGRETSLSTAEEQETEQALAQFTTATARARRALFRRRLFGRPHRNTASWN